MIAKCLLKKKPACLCEELCFVAYWLEEKKRRIT